MLTHVYRKLLVPARREARWIQRHRDLGHAVVHYGQPEQPSGVHNRVGRCYWYCSCQARYWC
jgi:hypothetical protein